MTLDKQVLENIDRAVKFLRSHPTDTVFISLRDNEAKYIEWMVTRSAAGTWYYGDRWIYWDGSIYGFLFDPSIVPEIEVLPTEELN